MPCMQMEVGIEDCLHIEFEYDRGRYHLRDTVVGKIYFLLVRIKLKHMEVRSRLFGQLCWLVACPLRDGDVIMLKQMTQLLGQASPSTSCREPGIVFRYTDQAWVHEAGHVRIRLAQLLSPVRCNQHCKPYSSKAAAGCQQSLQGSTAGTCTRHQARLDAVQIEIKRRETTGQGSSTRNESETLAKYEIMDGAPVRGESVPIRCLMCRYACCQPSALACSVQPRTCYAPACDSGAPPAWQK